MVAIELKWDAHPQCASTNAARPSPNGAYRSDIDGLRAIAVASVVFYHANLWPLSSGYVGVDIFFVISGYLIGGILYRDIRAGTFSFARFYARRAKRILPALLAVALFVCLIALPVMGTRELRQTGFSVATALVGFSNIYFWWSTNYFNPTSHLNPFLMTWSLGVEEQFYLLVPTLLLLLAKWPARRAMAVLTGLTLLSFAICVAVTAYDPTAAFYLLPMRAWELGCGSLLAIWSIHRKSTAPDNVHHVVGAMGIAALILSCLAFDDMTPFPGWVAAIPVLGTVAVIYAERGWINQRLLSSAPMVGIGLISYSWYLWHAPLMALTRMLVFGHADTALLCGVAFVSLGCAYLSWRFVERPFRHMAMPDGMTLKRYGFALLAALTLPAAFVATHGLPQRLNEHGKAVERTLAGGRGNSCLVSYGETVPATRSGCRTVASATMRAVALVGDSHAAALGTALKEIAARQHVMLVQMEKSSCAPLLGATRTMARYPMHSQECAEFNEKVFQALAADRRIDTVILGGYWSASFQAGSNDGSVMISTHPARGPAPADQRVVLRDALRETIQRYRAVGKHVILLGDVTMLAFDPGVVAINDILPARRWLASLFGKPEGIADGRADTYWLRPGTIADRIVAQEGRAGTGATYFPLNGQLCDRGRCAYMSDGLPAYIDFQHLSRPGALLALRTLKL